MSLKKAMMVFGVMRLGQTPDVLPKVVKPLVDMLTAK